MTWHSLPPLPLAPAARCPPPAPAAHLAPSRLQTLPRRLDAAATLSPAHSQRRLFGVEGERVSRSLKGESRGRRGILVPVIRVGRSRSPLPARRRATPVTRALAA